MCLTDWFQTEFLLICITVGGKNRFHFKGTKSLKGCISSTLCGRHTKCGSHLSERVINTSIVLLWCCIMLFGNHGNQHDLKSVQTPDEYYVPMWRLSLNKDLGWCCFTRIFSSRYGKILYFSSLNNGKFNFSLNFKRSKYHVCKGRILYGFCGPAKYTAAM